MGKNWLLKVKSQYRSQSYVVSSGSVSVNPKPAVASSSSATVTLNPQNLNENVSDTDSETVAMPASNRGVRLMNL